VFESAVSSKLITVVFKEYPRMRDTLDVLPPKLLRLSSTRSAEPVDLDMLLEQSVETVEASIERATFTGKGDKQTVTKLYKDYVERIARVLTTLLTIAPHADGARPAAMVPPPQVALSPVVPLRLAAGQLVLALSSNHRDTELGEVAEDGLRVTRVFSGNTVELSIDSCSQTVLPWRPPADDSSGDAALLHDLELLRSLASDLSAVTDILKLPISEAGLRGAGKKARSALDSVRKQAHAHGLQDAAKKAKLKNRAAEVEDKVTKGLGDKGSTSERGNER
jgi:hypothetical protein